MKIVITHFDDHAKAVYIELKKKKKVAKTEKFAPDVFIDLDKKGKLIGIEILHPGRFNITEFHEGEREKWREKQAERISQVRKKRKKQKKASKKKDA